LQEVPPDRNAVVIGVFLVTLAESKYHRIVLDTFKKLCNDLSAELPESDAAAAFVAFLDLGKTEILIRNRKSGQTYASTYFEAWCNHLHIATPEEYRQQVRSYLSTSDGRLLLPYLDDLFEAAMEIGIKWDRAEILIREALLRSKLSRKQVRPKSRSGVRSKDVAMRHAVLRRMGGQVRSLRHSDVCKNFDSENIKVPESWIQTKGVNPVGQNPWQEALKKCPKLVHKLISTYMSRIRDRDS
jgi:hypothetical protein